MQSCCVNSMQSLQWSSMTDYFVHRSNHSTEWRSSTQLLGSNDYRSANSSRSLYLFLSLLNVLRYSLLFSIMRYRNFYSCILSRYNYWIENAWWFPIQYCIPALLWDSCHDVLVFSCMVLFICTKESKWSECKEMHSLRSKLCSVLVLSTGSMTSWCDGPLEI
jgi:hypothetical protein